jgi:hypothetical protein
MTDLHVWYLLRQRLEELRHETTAQGRAMRLHAVLAADRAAARREPEGRARARRERRGGLAGGVWRLARRGRRGAGRSVVPSAGPSVRRSAPVMPQAACCCDGGACCASAA